MSDRGPPRGSDAPAGPSLRRGRLARITDVAERAGLSTATVDRVLNRRPGVRSTTVQRVLKAAAEIDYILVIPARADGAEGRVGRLSGPVWPNVVGSCGHVP